jgi:tRNA(adenine34) deaminase
MRLTDCSCTRRSALLALPAALAATLPAAAAPRPDGEHRPFLAEAFRQRDLAVKAGDQPYGAVVVRDGRILGRAASRVIQDRDSEAHAERLAIADASRSFGAELVSRATLYSSSRPCRACERAAAAARIARMIHGEGATDAGAPQS